MHPGASRNNKFVEPPLQPVTSIVIERLAYFADLSFFNHTKKKKKHFSKNHPSQKFTINVASNNDVLRPYHEKGSMALAQCWPDPKQVDLHINSLAPILRPDFISRWDPHGNNSLSESWTTVYHDDEQSYRESIYLQRHHTWCLRTISYDVATTPTSPTWWEARSDMRQEELAKLQPKSSQRFAMSTSRGKGLITSTSIDLEPMESLERSHSPTNPMHHGLPWQLMTLSVLIRKNVMPRGLNCSLLHANN